MKTLFMAAAVLAATISYGQSDQPVLPVSQTQQPKPASNHTPEKRAVMVLRMMTSKVNLSDAQQGNVRTILLDREKAREAAISKHAGNKEAAKPEVKAAMKAADAKLQKELTAEQWTNWETYRKEEAQRRKEKKAEQPKTGSTTPAPNKEEDFY